jgi:hypothetical protein
VLSLLVRFLNQTQDQERRTLMVTSSLLGFWCVLNTQNPAYRAAITSKLDSIANPAYRRIIRRSLRTTPEALLAKMPPSPACNDTAWGAYFAAADTHYLDLLLRNCRYANKAKNHPLYLTGATARWSLAANARQDPSVRAYLRQQRTTNPEARLILEALGN